jgi:uncharacterized membrane protein YgcG
VGGWCRKVMLRSRADVEIFRLLVVVVVVVEVLVVVVGVRDDRWSGGNGGGGGGGGRKAASQLSEGGGQAGQWETQARARDDDTHNGDGAGRV